MRAKQNQEAATARFKPTAAMHPTQVQEQIVPSELNFKKSFQEALKEKEINSLEDQIFSMQADHKRKLMEKDKQIELIQQQIAAIKVKHRKEFLEKDKQSFSKNNSLLRVKEKY